MTARRRVLVVEDDEEIRESLLDILTDHGYEAVGAVDGRDALDRLADGGARPALILLDLMMPVMDGRSFREAQLRDPALAGIPVIVLSAHRDTVYRVSDLAPAAHLKKPLKLPELLRLVKEHSAPA